MKEGRNFFKVSIKYQEIDTMFLMHFHLIEKIYFFDGLRQKIKIKKIEMYPGNLEFSKAFFKNSICPFSVEPIQSCLARLNTPPAAASKSPIRYTPFRLRLIDVKNYE